MREILSLSKTCRAFLAVALCMPMLSFGTSVTVSVDMNDYAGSADYATLGVTLNGLFNGWCGDCTPMADLNGDGIYELELDMNEGNQEYKFSIGNWIDQEALAQGSPCTLTTAGFTNRQLTVGTEAIVVEPVCWGSCAACGQGNEDLENVSFSVDMNGYLGTQDFATLGVNLNGEFNEWCGVCNPMSDADSDGIYEVTLPLAAGEYAFKYVIGNWVDDETLTNGTPCTIFDGEFTNRLVTVADAPIDLGVSCWNACEACGNVLEPQEITFRVDMNEYAGPEDYAMLGVNVNGTFNEWCGDCNPMDDTDGDGVYELTLSLPQGYYDFKYAIGPWTDQEALTPGSPCTATTDGFTNRNFTLENEAQDLGTVCWNSCTACGVIAEEYDVTLRVDMNEYAGGEDYATLGVNVFGTFNNWCATCDPMADMDGDGIYEVTLSLPASTIEFKYLIGDGIGNENLTAGSDCTITTAGFTNRTLEIAADTDMETVCWSACVACDDIVEPTLYSVTFQVDMNQYAGMLDYTTAGVNVNGTFNEWCGECWAMTDADADGVYEFTADVPEGNVEYKFVIGNWTEQEEFDGSESCVNNPGGFWNRWIENLAGDTVLDAVCYASCEACVEEIEPCANPDALICDNLDTYATGPLNGAAAHWTTWSGTLGGTEDGIVSTDQAVSNTKSLLIAEGPVPAEAQDVLLLLGNRTEGAYDLSWMQYIPAGATGYYNIQEDETPNVGFNFTVYFNRGGNSPGVGEVLIDGADPEIEYTFDYPEGAWFSMEHYFNLETDFLKLTVDGTEVVGNYPYPGNIGAIDFFSRDAANRYYIDDVLFDTAEIVDNVGSVDAASFAVFPNPATDLVQIKADGNIESITLSDVLGKIVVAQSPRTGANVQLNLSELATGTYILSVVSEGRISTQRIVKK